MTIAACLRHHGRTRYSHLLGYRSRLALAKLRSLLVVALLLASPVGPQATPARAADGAWLDELPLSQWNTPGMEIPPANDLGLPIDPRSVARERSPETPEDEALVAAGWRLFAAYQAGWGVTVVQAAGAYDGMGRPWSYQAFVFVDGALAGTLSPYPMNARSDGALDRVSLLAADDIRGEFRRYVPSDPLCCPSGSSTVRFHIDRSDQGSVVRPTEVSARSGGEGA